MSLARVQYRTIAFSLDCASLLRLALQDLGFKLPEALRGCRRITHFDFATRVVAPLASSAVMPAATVASDLWSSKSGTLVKRRDNVSLKP